MILFTLGVLVVGIGLVAVLVAGADAVNESVETIPYSDNLSHSISGSNRDQDLAFVSEYLKLVGLLSICVALLILGVILGAFLIKGANESNSLYLQWWILHAVICLAWLVIAEILSADSIFNFLLRISVPSLLYGFAISVVVSLLREIRKEKGQRLNRNGREKLPPQAKKATDKMYSTHSEPETVVSSIIAPIEAKSQSKV